MGRRLRPPRLGRAGWSRGPAGEPVGRCPTLPRITVDAFVGPRRPTESRPMSMSMSLCHGVGWGEFGLAVQAGFVWPGTASSGTTNRAPAMRRRPSRWQLRAPLPVGAASPRARAGAVAGRASRCRADVADQGGHAAAAGHVDAGAQVRGHHAEQELPDPEAATQEKRRVNSASSVSVTISPMVAAVVSAPAVIAD